MHANNICLKQALKLFKAGLKIRVIKSVLKLKSQPMTLIFIRNSGPLQCIDNLRSWGEPRGVQPCRCPCVVVNCLSADQEAVYFIKCNWIEIMQFRSWHIMCTLFTPGERGVCVITTTWHQTFWLINWASSRSCRKVKESPAERCKWVECWKSEDSRLRLPQSHTLGGIINASVYVMGMSSGVLALWDKRNKTVWFGNIFQSPFSPPCLSSYICVICPGN